MKRASLSDAYLDNATTLAEWEEAQRKGVHPLEHHSCFESLSFMTNSDVDWKQTVEPNNPYLHAWRLIEPLLVYPPERELLQALKTIHDIDESAIYIYQRRILVEHRISSPLLTDLLNVYRKSPYGAGMMKAACLDGMEEAVFYLDKCGISIDPFIETLIVNDRTSILNRWLNRRVHDWYASPYLLSRAPPSMCRFLLTHPKVIVYFEQEALDLRATINHIALHDQIDLFELAIERGFPMITDSEDDTQYLLNNAMLGKPHYRILGRLMTMGIDDSENCVGTVKTMISSVPRFSPETLETVLRLLPQQPVATSTYVSLFLFTCMRGDHIIYENLSVYLAPLAIPHILQEGGRLQERLLQLLAYLPTRRYPRLFEALSRFIQPTEHQITSQFNTLFDLMYLMDDKHLEAFVRLDVDLVSLIHQQWCKIRDRSMFMYRQSSAMYWFRQFQSYYTRPLSADLFGLFAVIAHNDINGQDVPEFLNRFAGKDPDGLLAAWLFDLIGPNNRTYYHHFPLLNMDPVPLMERYLKYPVNEHNFKIISHFLSALSECYPYTVFAQCCDKVFRRLQGSENRSWVERLPKCAFVNVRRTRSSIKRLGRVILTEPT